MIDKQIHKSYHESMVRQAELSGVRLTRDEEGYGFFVLDGDLLRGEWVPWAEAATLEVIENCVRMLPQVQTVIKENSRKDWKWNWKWEGKTQVSARKVRNVLNKLLALLEG